MVMKLAYSRSAPTLRRAVPAGARPRRAARRRQRARRGAAAHARAHDRGRRVADPAQHHRRACARPAPGAALMDLELSDDQVALRDGIASMLDGARSDRAGPRRLRPRAVRRARRTRACSRCAPTASPGPTASSCSSSSAGSACPARSSRRCCVGDGRIAGVVETAPIWVEHLDTLDVVVVRPGTALLRRPGDRRGRRRRRGRSIRAHRSHASPARPLRSPRPTSTGRSGDVRAQRSLRRCSSAWPTVSPSSRSPTRRSACSSTGRSARSRRSSTCCADMLVRTEVARAAVYAAGAASRRGRRRAGVDRAVERRQGARRRRGDRQRQGRDAGVRRHGLHVGGRRAPLPEAGVGARHALRLRRHARRCDGRGAAAAT